MTQQRERAEEYYRAAWGMDEKARAATDLERRCELLRRRDQLIDEAMALELEISPPAPCDRSR